MITSRAILIASFFLSFSCFTQTVSSMGGSPNGILFKEFENVVQITDDKRENREFQVIFTGGFVETIEANDAKSSEGRYVLRATTANLNPEIIVLDSTGQVLNKVAFTVQEIPASSIKFATENGAYSVNVKQLLVSNPIPFIEKLQEIAGWKINIDGVILL